MRKNAAVIILSAFVLSSSICAEGITIDSTLDVINISGESTFTRQEIPVAIVKPGKLFEDAVNLDTNEIIGFFGTAKTDDNGAYSLAAIMPDDAEAGNFSVYDDSDTAAFWYAGANIRNAASNSFKNSDVNIVKEYTENEDVYYGICAGERNDYADYFLPLNSSLREKVYSEIGSYTYDTDISTPENRHKLITEFAWQFEKSAYEVFKANGLESIADIVTQENVYTVLDKYKHIWGIDIGKLTDNSCQNEINANLLKSIKSSYAKTEDEIQKQLYSQGCLSKINNLKSANAGNLLIYLDEYGMYLGFNASDTGIFSLSEVQRNNVALNVIKTDYDSSESLKEAIIRAVSSEKNKSSGGGSSGGGSGSPARQVSPKKFVTPENEGTGFVAAAEKDDLFDDLDKYEWSKEAILNLAAMGIVSGIGERKFEPERPIKREEFLKIVLNSFGVDIKTGAVDFVDVNSSEWYAPFVATAFNSKIVQGIGEDKFGIGKNITREDAAVIIYNLDAMFSKKMINESLKTFNDENEISEYAVNAVKVLGGNNIISGYEDGAFKPKSNMTRAEICVIMNRLIENGGAEG